MSAKTMPSELYFPFESRVELARLRHLEQRGVLDNGEKTRMQLLEGKKAALSTARDRWQAEQDWIEIERKMRAVHEAGAVTAGPSS